MRLFGPEMASSIRPDNGPAIPRANSEQSVVPSEYERMAREKNKTRKSPDGDLLRATCRRRGGILLGRQLITGLGLLLASLFAQPVTAQENGLHVMPAVLMHSDMPAFRGFIPAGWQSTGGLTWGDPCMIYGYNINWKAISPDNGRYGVAFLPNLAWGLSGHNNCRQQPLGSLRELLAYEAQSIWPGARMLDFRQRPDLVGGQAVPVEKPEFSMDKPGLTMRAQMDAGEALFSFTAGGRDMRGAILDSGYFGEMRLDPAASRLRLDSRLFPGLAMPPPPHAQTFLNGNSVQGFAVWAPDGELDLRAAEAVRKSFIPTAEWADFIAKHRAVIDGQNTEGIITRGEIRRRTNAEIGDMIVEGYNERMAVNDRIHRENMEAVRGVETYLNTSGQPVQLDYNYRNAWQLADGSYFLTNDANFNPNAAFNMDGRQLQVAP